MPSTDAHQCLCWNYTRRFVGLNSSKSADITRKPSMFTRKPFMPFFCRLFTLLICTYIQVSILQIFHCIHAEWWSVMQFLAVDWTYWPWQIFWRSQPRDKFSWTETICKIYDFWTILWLDLQYSVLTILTKKMKCSLARKLRRLQHPGFYSQRWAFSFPQIPTHSRSSLTSRKATTSVDPNEMPQLFSPLHLVECRRIKTFECALWKKSSCGRNQARAANEKGRKVKKASSSVVKFHTTSKFKGGPDTKGRALSCNEVLRQASLWNPHESSNTRQITTQLQVDISYCDCLNTDTSHAKACTEGAQILASVASKYTPDGVNTAWHSEQSGGIKDHDKQRLWLSKSSICSHGRSNFCTYSSCALTLIHFCGGSKNRRPLQ